MLNFMRRKRSALKWLWVFLIFVFSVSLVALYIPQQSVIGIGVSGDVAEVGESVVSAQEFQTAYRSHLQRMRSSLTPEAQRAYQFERQIIDTLINRKVISEEARQLGLDVTPAEIERRIVEEPGFLENGNFIGVERYRALLAQRSLTVAEFERSLRDEMLGRKLHSFVTAGLNVSDQEAEDEYRRRNEKAKLDYFIIDPDELEATVTASDLDLREYFEKNKANYNIPEKRRADYILVETEKMVSQVTIPEEELQPYYNQNQSLFVRPETVTAQHILFRTQNRKPEDIPGIQQKARSVLERAKKGEFEP